MDLQDIASLSVKEKIGQLFFIGIPGPQIDSQTSDLLTKILPGGVCLFARNIREQEQTRDLLDEIREISPIEPFLSLDQEGGLVDRLRRVLSPMPAPNKILNTEDAGHFASIAAEAVRILGFNMNFAPVVDVIDYTRSTSSNGLHSRVFGSSSQEVVELAGTFLQVMQENGCAGCLKHFPGLGAATVDSHEELPSIELTADQLFAVDLFPYRSLFITHDVTAVMVAHAVYPQHRLQETGQNGKLLPTSLSSNIVTTLLRHELGFEGLVLTDDLEMGAIVKNYGIGEACVLAILAGEDMVSICAGVDSIYDGHKAVTEAVETGRISMERIDQSIKRIASTKSKLCPPLRFDKDRLDTLSTEITALNIRVN
jgi:beta-N-acetylhexosaminidase